MPGLVQFSEAVSIALHSMALLAGSEKLLNARYIARETGASETHLAKVMQRLTKAGLVHSTRGPGGGFLLKKPGNSITLLEVYQAIEGPVETGECILSRKNCPFQQCLFGGFLERIADEFRNFLAQQTLDNLVQFSPVRSKDVRQES